MRDEVQDWRELIMMCHIFFDLELLTQEEMLDLYADIDEKYVGALNNFYAQIKQ